MYVNCAVHLGVLYTVFQSAKSISLNSEQKFFK